MEAELKNLGIDKERFDTERKLILAGYEEKRVQACKRGTKIHSMLENSFYDKTDFDFSRFGMSQLNGKYVCRKQDYSLDIEDGIYPEYFLHKESRDGLLNVAGSIDLMIKRGNHLILWDYKTNASIDQKSYYNRKSGYQMMKFPLNNLMDCNYYHYSLQLSTYAYLLQQINPEFIIDDLMIYHIDHDGHERSYHVDYLKDDVERMLRHYKKKIKMKMELDKDKPIVM